MLRAEDFNWSVAWCIAGGRDIHSRITVRRTFCSGMGRSSRFLQRAYPKQPG
jgi:hypothetical protein